MRVMTRRAAGLLDPPWDAAAAATVGGFFDTLASDWHTRSSPARTAVVVDALDRGDVGAPDGVCVEIGSGIGAYTALLAERFSAVVACDLSLEMLGRAAASAGPRVQADASALPVAAGAVTTVVLVNMFLFPAELDRVLAPEATVVWVNSSGESTPIHLTPDEVLAALPGTWRGVRARAGIGLWAVARRG